jgi:electron transport complex protein RnfA
MASDASLFAVFMDGVFLKNFLVVQFLGLCSFVGVTKDVKSASGMSVAVLFVITMSSIVSYLLYTYILVPLRLDYLNTIAFIIVIAALVQLVEFVVRKFMPPLYRSLGIYLPLISTNCAVLGAVLLNVTNEYNFIQSVTFGFAAAVGYTVAMLIMSSIRERSNLLHVPPAVGRGVTYAFFVALIISMSFANYFKVIPL